MYSTKLIIGGIVGAVIFVALFFIPTNQFFGIDSYNTESPPPIVVLSNYPESFEIIPIKCTTKSDTVEFQFNVENKLDENYRLEIHLVLNDINNESLSRQAILIETHSGETTFESHQTPYNSDMTTCTIELKHSEKIL